MQEAVKIRDYYSTNLTPEECDEIFELAIDAAELGVDLSWRYDGAETGEDIPLNRDDKADLEAMRRFVREAKEKADA